MWLLRAGADTLAAALPRRLEHSFTRGHLEQGDWKQHNERPGIAHAVAPPLGHDAGTVRGEVGLSQGLGGPLPPAFLIFMRIWYQGLQ